MSSERDLIILAKTGDEKSKLKLVSLCRADIEIASLKFADFFDREDLIQEGRIGVLHAIRNYKFSKGVGFKTYAPYYINRYVHSAVADQARLIRIPRETLSDWREIKAAEDELIRNKKTPTTRLVSDITGFVEEYIDDVRSAIAIPSSIEGLASEYSDRTSDSGDPYTSLIANQLLSIVHEPYNFNDDANYRETAERRIELENASRFLYRAMEHLTLREFQVVERLYGFNGREPMTPTDVANDLGVKIAAISNAHRRARDRLADHLSNKLNWFLDNIE